jgi:hypothetical protein
MVLGLPHSKGSLLAGINAPQPRVIIAVISRLTSLPRFEATNKIFGSCKTTPAYRKAKT